MLRQNDSGKRVSLQTQIIGCRCSPPCTFWACKESNHQAKPGMTDLLGANGSNSHLPRITIVTPALGNDDQLEATIRSVVHQDYPHLEYIIIEDGTSEKRREIIRQYASRLTWRCCPANTELCRAVNMAFAESSGEIMGWLEPGEMLHINGVQVIGSVFSAFPEVDWITGRPF